MSKSASNFSKQHDSVHKLSKQKDACTNELEHNAELTLQDKDRQPCEVWTRVMGYHRPVSAFNIGKQGEHAERLHFVENTVLHHDEVLTSTN